MSFKIDTKEKFTVITPESDSMNANIAADLWETATSCINSEEGNVIVNFQNVLKADSDAVTSLASLQQHFYDHKKSFVLCNVCADVMVVVKNEALIDVLNITPSESEAWDIVQMEEIERELMDDTDDV